MWQKTLLLLVLVGGFSHGLLRFANADESGLQSCMTYCRLNYDPNYRPSEQAQCVERCKREHGKDSKWEWDRTDRIK